MWTKAQYPQKQEFVFGEECDFKHQQVSITNSIPNGVVSLQIENGSIFNEEVRRKEQGSLSRFEDDIRHEKTPPKTPQLNGLAERMNMTLIEIVRCMLFEAKLPKHFLGETLYTTVHVINLNPTVSLNTEMPDKIWFGKDVKLYDPIEKKLVKSDVQFMDDQTIKDIDMVKKTTPEKDNNLFEIDQVQMLVHDLDTVENNLGDDFDVPPNDDIEKEQEMSQDENPSDAPKPPLVQLKRSNRSM
ncbi:hypothetical protein CR513_10889, partial [Mucuna pruriens]